MITREDGGGDDEDNWWGSWEHGCRMAMTQILCYVACAICIFGVNYDRQCADAAESGRVEKRKAHAWERQFESLGEAIGTVVKAIREGYATMECGRQSDHSEEEVFAESVNKGIEQTKVQSLQISC